MVERHLDRVTYLRDLIVEATDVLIGDVGDLGREELLDVLANDPFEGNASASVDHE